MDAPLTQYALRDGMHVGYQVWGADPGVGGGAPVDVLEFNSGLMISIDEAVDEPNWLRYTERVAEFSRLIRFDTGGLGLSDPLPAGTDPSIESWGRDALAVMDAAGCSTAVVLAPTGGALAALWLAATHPERVTSLVIVNGTARVGQAEDYGFGVADEQVAEAANIDVPLIEGDVPQDIAVFAPSLAHRVGFRDWWERAARRGASPAHRDRVQPRHLLRGPALVPARHHLPDARHRAHGELRQPQRTRALPGRAHRGRPLRDLPGTRPAPLGRRVRLHRRRDRGVRDRGPRRACAHPHAGHRALHRHRGLHGARAAALGDRQWRAVLDESDVNVGRLLSRHDGVLVKTTGDGILARFTSPAQAVRCAAALVEAARTSGLQLRAGLHVGEVELRGDDIGGLAVHIASRVSAMAGADEVLVTGTVRDLVVGSGIAFDDRGQHDLKGVPGEWQILAVGRA